MREVTLQQFAEAAARGEPWATDLMTGTSPGPAAEALGVSRQAVHQLLQRGSLEGFRVVDRRGNLAAILITAESLKRRRLARRSAA